MTSHGNMSRYGITFTDPSGFRWTHRHHADTLAAARREAKWVSRSQTRGVVHLADAAGQWLEDYHEGQLLPERPEGKA